MLRKSYGSLSLGLAGILSVSTILSGCAQNPGIRNTSRTSAAAADTQIGLLPGDSPEFNNFLMDLFNEQITSNSIDFHYSLEHPENYGLSMENVTFGTVDISNLDQDLEDTKAVLDQLRDFDYDTLSSRQQLIYDMLEENFQDSIDSIDYTLYQTIFSPTIGIQAQLPVILSEYTFRTQQDIDDYILLLEDVDRYFSELLDVEKAKSEAGFFMADFTADAVISQCQEFIASPQENLLIDIFQEKLDSEMPELSQEQKDDYIRRNQDAVLNHVIPAYENLIEGLTALKGTGTNEGGLANYENGADYYSMLAKSATGSSKTVDEMIQLTDDALSDDLNTILTLYFSDTDLLTEMTEAQPPSTDPREILDMLQTAITDEFPQPVSGEFTIKYVHKSLEENLSPAFYMVPAIDAVDSNTIYINNDYRNNSKNI